MKQPYVTPEVHVAGSVAGLTRAAVSGSCYDSAEPSPLNFDHTRPGNCAPGGGGGFS